MSWKFKTRLICFAVVSTKVGGVPEVLPSKYIYFAEPDPADIETTLCSAIEDLLAGKRPSARECHGFVRESYSWTEVAARTERVYELITANRTPPTLARRVRNLWERGRVAGPMMAALYLFCHYLIKILDAVSPVKKCKYRAQRHCDAFSSEQSKPR